MTGPGRELSEAIRAADVARALAVVDADPALLGARLAGNETPLMLAAGRSRHGAAWGRLARELLARGSALDLFSAVMLGEAGAAMAMLQDDPQLAYRRSPGGWSPLHFAARESALELIETLLAAGADVNAAHPRWLLTPLFWASATPAIEVLLARGAHVRHQARHGLTVLHCAAAAGDPERVALLLRRGADPHAQTYARQTPWALAVRFGHREAAQILATCGPLD